MLERVIREGCPFFVGMERVFFWWKGGFLLGREGNVRREGGKSPSGKSVSPVPPLEGYLGGVVGESAVKRGYESPAPLQRIACGGHSGGYRFSRRVSHAHQSHRNAHTHHKYCHLNFFLINLQFT